MGPHSSILAWEIPWTEEPGGLHSIGYQRIRHGRASKQHTFCSGSQIHPFHHCRSPIHGISELGGTYLTPSRNPTGLRALMDTLQRLRMAAEP